MVVVASKHCIGWPLKIAQQAITLLMDHIGTRYATTSWSAMLLLEGFSGGYSWLSRLHCNAYY